MSFDEPRAELMCELRDKEFENEKLHEESENLKAELKLCRDSLSRSTIELVVQEEKIENIKLEVKLYKDNLYRLSKQDIQIPCSFIRELTSENKRLTTEIKINERLFKIREKNIAEINANSIGWQKCYSKLKQKLEGLEGIK